MEESSGLEDAILSLPCDCGQELQESVGRLRIQPTLLCPNCGAKVRVDADALPQEIDVEEE
jgi:transcription elongation factor Elf1